MKRTQTKKPDKRKDMNSSPIANPVVNRAYASLKARGLPIGDTTRSLRVVLDVAILNAAKDRTHIVDNSALINAALAVLAAEDDFGQYLIAQAGRLSSDFELAV